MVEILILNLRPGTRERFHKVYTKESLPLQKNWDIKVIAHGPCLHDENGYWVIRSFKSLAHRQKSEDAFYASDDWQNGPRAIILDLIVSSAYMVVSPESIKEWVSGLGEKPLAE